MTKISIILPCKNEEIALPLCLKEIKETIEKNKLDAELIAVDNNSNDKTQNIIKEFQRYYPKLKYCFEAQPGYGSAYLAGINKASGEYIFMADSDGTYDFKQIPNFTYYLKNGYDFVIGDRFKGSIAKKAMPWHHKYIGNPVLSGLLKLFFGNKVNDAHCGMRAIKRSAIQKLNLRTTGMEFASEMVIKSIKNNLKIKEIPIEYKERQGKSKLRSFRDGWRHLRFLLLYSPLYLFFIPGLISIFIGLNALAWFYFGSPELFGKTLYYHPMFLSSILTTIGYQLIIFAIFAKTYAITHLDEKNKIVSKLYKYLTVEKTIIVGISLIFLGLMTYIAILIKWINNGFGNISEIKNSILGLTLITIGVQTVFSSFMLSILSIKEK